MIAERAGAKSTAMLIVVLRRIAMIRDDRIDVITISVKVPARGELVLAALDAGKAVYCEAPFRRTVAEAEDMASSRFTSYRDWTPARRVCVKPPITSAAWEGALWCRIHGGSRRTSTAV